MFARLAKVDGFGLRVARGIAMSKDSISGGSAGSVVVASEIAADAAVYRHIVENAADLIVRGDANRKRTFVSPSSREILGYEPEELFGGHALELVHADDRDHVALVMKKLGPGMPSADLTFRMRRKDGQYIWIDGRYRYLPEDDGVLAILRDITARKRTEDALAAANAKLETANLLLRRMAHQDGLTGLANRRRFDELLDEEFRRARRHELPLGVVLLDVDCFKLYNDHYGHLAGDQCLISISRAVEGATRRPGDQAARYGGEEIVVLLPVTDLAGTVAIAERIREAVSMLAIAHPGSPDGIVTISAGASSMIPIRSDTVPAELVSAADQALYRAKAEGRNRVCAGPLHTDMAPFSSESRVFH
jgi:diguanylate cyclase (GGDEF)-like protein/PAS domain S-box-containing protein